MTFLSRLAAQVPPRWFHMLTYHGVLAAAAARRHEVVPGHEGDQGDAQPCRSRRSPGAPGAGSRPRSRPERMFWADLVRRVWLVDILACPCGGRRSVLAMVFDPRAIERVLTHMGLPFSPPERSPPREVEKGLPFSGD